MFQNLIQIYTELNKFDVVILYSIDAIITVHETNRIKIEQLR